MMKFKTNALTRLLPLLIFILFVNTGMYGQSEKGDFWSSIEARSSAFSGKGKRHVEVAYSLGYNITNRFSAAINLEDAVSLFEIEGEKDHYMNAVGGGKFIFKAFKRKNTDYGIECGAGATLDDKAWKYAYYDISVFTSHPIGKVRTFVSYGYRYYDSMSRSFGNHWRFRISIGCVFPMELIFK